MRSPQKLTQNPDRLPPMGKLNEPRILASGDSLIGRAQSKHAHMKAPRIKPANDLTRVAHLRVWQPGVGKTIHQNANRAHCRAAMPEKQTSAESVCTV